MFSSSFLKLLFLLLLLFSVICYDYYVSMVMVQSLKNTPAVDDPFLMCCRYINMMMNLTPFV